MATTHSRLPAKPQAILFDLDGTLIDSAHDLGGAANTLLERRQRPTLPIAVYRPQVGSGARGILTIAFPEIDPKSAPFTQLCEEFCDVYAETLGVQTAIFEGVDALLHTLEQRGIAWGIVTNKVERFSIPLIASLAELRRAPVLICGDTTSHPKPHPLPLQEAAKRLGVDPAQCVYVGDDIRDMQAGKAAGMATVAALYGFIAETENTDNWPSDYGIDCPLDLLKLLPIA